MSNPFESGSTGFIDEEDEDTLELELTPEQSQRLANAFAIAEATPVPGAANRAPSAAEPVSLAAVTAPSPEDPNATTAETAVLPAEPVAIEEKAALLSVEPISIAVKAAPPPAEPVALIVKATPLPAEVVVPAAKPWPLPTEPAARAAKAAPVAPAAIPTPTQSVPPAATASPASQALPKAVPKRADPVPKATAAGDTRIALVAGVVAVAILVGVIAFLAKPRARQATATVDIAPFSVTTRKLELPPPPPPVAAGEPVRYANPFDAREVFEFPPGTSRTDARDAVSDILLKRALERRNPSVATPRPQNKPERPNTPPGRTSFAERS